MREIKLDSSDRDEIITIINTIQTSLVDFEEHQDISFEEYIKPENRMTRKAIRETFIETVEACLSAIDILLTYVVDSRPGERKEKFKVAHQEDLLPYDLKEDMLSAVGFRDVLAHKYGAVVNHQIVHDAIRKDIEKYRNFKSLLEEYVYK